MPDLPSCKSETQDKIFSKNKNIFSFRNIATSQAYICYSNVKNSIEVLLIAE